MMPLLMFVIVLCFAVFIVTIISAVPAIIVGYASDNWYIAKQIWIILWITLAVIIIINFIRWI